MTTGYIYKLICSKTNKFYIGSTTKNINSRLRQHELYPMNNVREVLKNNSYSMILLETMEFDIPAMLTSQEGMYIRSACKDCCVNKNIAGRTKKEYYLDNAEEIKRKQMIYDNSHKLEKSAYYFKKKNQSLAKQVAELKLINGSLSEELANCADPDYVFNSDF